MADTSKYQLLEPLSTGQSDPVNTGDLSYFFNVYNVALTLVVALAVVMIVVGGVQYSASWASPSAKGDAKNRILAAIGGLLLALMSYLILHTINPNLVTPNLNLQPINSTSGGTGGTDGGGTGSGAAGTLTNSQARAQLAAAGIQVTLPDCGATSGRCSSFEGVKQATIDEVIAVKNACACLLAVNDATGPGHATDAGHYSGDKIDVNRTPALNDFIKTNPSRFPQVGERNGDAVYRDTQSVDGLSTWTEESTHWDVSTIGK